jgi:hypothetical protein
MEPRDHQFTAHYFKKEFFLEDNLKYLNLWMDLIGTVQSHPQLETLKLSGPENLIKDIRSWNSFSDTTGADINAILSAIEKAEEAFKIKESDIVIAMKVNPIKEFAMRKLQENKL